MSSFGATVFFFSENVVKLLLKRTNEVICRTRTFSKKVIYVSLVACLSNMF